MTVKDIFVSVAPSIEFSNSWRKAGILPSASHLGRFSCFNLQNSELVELKQGRPVGAGVDSTEFLK